MRNASQSKTRSEGGFSLIELMIATLLFTTIAGITFALLGVSLQALQGRKGLPELLPASQRGDGPDRPRRAFGRVSASEFLHGGDGGA